jgi:hypothetical protein
MSALLKNRWMWVGIAWAVAVSLTFWNHQQIDFIMSLKGQNQDLSKELVFQEQNFRKLERVQKEHSRLFLSTESVQLGVLSARSVVSELASACELNMVQMTLASIQKGAETVSLNLTLVGAFEKMMNFFSAMRAHPYLQDKQVLIRIDPKTAECSCDLSMNLRFRVQPQTADSRPHEAQVRSTL